MNWMKALDWFTVAVFVMYVLLGLPYILGWSNRPGPAADSFAPIVGIIFVYWFLRWRKRKSRPTA